MALKTKKPSTILRVLIWFAIFPTLVGELFKIMHWPAASLIMVFGTFVLAFFYLPLYFLESWDSSTTKKEKALLISQVSVLFLFSLGFMFKIMHWPGAGIFYVINNGILLVLVIPFALLRLKKAGNSDLNKSHGILLATYFFCLCIGSLMNSGSGRIKINTALQQGLNTESALKAAVSRNRHLYASIQNLPLEGNLSLLIKTNKLKTITDSTEVSIHRLKTQLVSACDEISQLQADTLSSLQIKNKVEFEIPTQILIGNEFKPNTHALSAYALKQKMNAYRDTVLSMVSETNRSIIKEGLNLNTNTYFDELGEPISWEMANFYEMPVLHVFNTLSSIQYEIKNAEYQVLTDLINSGNKELNTALFNEISLLNAKFESIQKEKEILKLQGENEKGLQLLSEKASELNDSKQTIFYFLFITLAFLVLIFFVIRSNYLRKLSNIALQQQKKIVEIQKAEVESQKHLVEEKQKEILESISYAKRLQEAILPPQQFIDAHLPNNFILYQPKDLVAGDFYWAEKVNDLFFIAAADSTGHGVPGAMVSVVCSNALNRAIKEFQLSDTGKILDKTRELVVETFAHKQNVGDLNSGDVKDGMDISLLCINHTQKQISWSGANNPLWYIQNDQFFEINADKQPIGKSDHIKPFTTHTISYQENTLFYLFTDGFADQFGGPKGKKFKYKQFSDLLITNKNLSQKQLCELINKTFKSWKGDLEQVDDVCVIGLKL